MYFPPWLVDIGVIVDASSGDRNTLVAVSSKSTFTGCGRRFLWAWISAEWRIIILWFAICFATIDHLTVFLEYSVATFSKTCGISLKGLHSFCRSSHVGFRWLRCVQQRNIDPWQQGLQAWKNSLYCSTCSTTTSTWSECALLQMDLGYAALVPVHYTTLHCKKQTQRRTHWQNSRNSIFPRWPCWTPPIIILSVYIRI